MATDLSLSQAFVARYTLFEIVAVDLSLGAVDGGRGRAFTTKDTKCHEGFGFSVLIGGVPKA